MRVFKYPLAAMSRQIVQMPKDAAILDLQVQGSVPTIWALVNPMSSFESRIFTIYGTGRDMPVNPGKYIGTFQLDDGVLVFHLFEEV